MTRLPKFVRVALVAALVSLLLTGLIAWQTDRLNDREARRDCERAVGYRDDGRAMWLYVIDANPGAGQADQARIDAFVAELNRRLPPLKCVDGNAVPDKP